MATPIGELNLPFVSIQGSRPKRGASTDRQPWLIETELGYTVSLHADVVALLADRRWRNGLDDMRREREPKFDEWMRNRQANLLAMDGDDHRRLRRVVGPWLTPQRIDGFRPMIRESITALIASVVDRPCDFIAEVCAPYANHVVFDLVGATPIWRERFEAIAGDRTINMASPPALIMEVTNAFDTLVDDLLDDPTQPRDHSLLAVIRESERDKTVSRAEAIMLIQNVIGGATDSTLAQLGSAVQLFGRFPDEYQRLRSQPDLAAQTVEEVLRYQGAARGTSRVAVEDVVYRDVLFPKGTMVIFGFMAANRDSEVFRDPSLFDVSRQDAVSHVSFGHGAHFCLGAALARAELVEAMNALVESVTDITIVGEVEWRPPTVDFWGPSVLPVLLASTP